MMAVRSRKSTLSVTYFIGFLHISLLGVGTAHRLKLGENLLHHSYNNISDFFFRFRDFEPRYRNLNNLEIRKAIAGNIDDDSIREARGFHLQASKDDFLVHMEFIVPFFHVPIAKTMQVTQSALRNLANLNSDSLVVSGMMIAAGAAVNGLVKLMKLPVVYTTQSEYGYMTKTNRAVNSIRSSIGKTPNDKVSKKANAINSTNLLFGDLKEHLQAKGLDLTSCVQKTICSYVGNAVADVRKGHGSAIDKIIDGLSNWQLVSNFLNGTALDQAISSGQLTAKDCERTFSKCRWSSMEEQLGKWLMKFWYQQNFNGS